MAITTPCLRVIPWTHWRGNQSLIKLLKSSKVRLSKSFKNNFRKLHPLSQALLEILDFGVDLSRDDIFQHRSKMLGEANATRAISENYTTCPKPCWKFLDFGVDLAMDNIFQHRSTMLGEAIATRGIPENCISCPKPCWKFWILGWICQGMIFFNMDPKC